MGQLGLLVRALRWRAGAAGALVVVATVAVAAAAAGPLYLDTAQDSVLQSTLRENTPVSNGMTVTPSAPTISSGLAASRARAVLKAAHRYRLGRWYRPGKITLDAGIEVTSPSQEMYQGDLISDPGQCAHLHLLAGACPTAKGQVALTSRSAAALDAKVGSHLELALPAPHEFLNGLPLISVGQLSVVVTGIVAVGHSHDPFWFGANYFDFGPPIFCAPGSTCLPQLDAFFTPAATALSDPVVQPIDEIPLRPDALHASALSAFASALNRYRAHVNTALGARVSTDLGSELTSVSNQVSLMEAIVLVVDLQLVLLALFVLVGLVGRTAEARQQEVALAKLRGFRLTSVMAVGLLEPLAMMCLALPAGLLLALLAVRLAQPLLLPGAWVAFQPLVIWSALAAFGGGLVACVVGARRILTRGLAEELRSVEARPSNAARAGLDAAALALALAGIVELLLAGVLNGSRPNPLAAFAPGLVAVAVAVVGVRGLPLLCGWLVRATRNGPWLASGLALRQVLRRPAALRQITVLAVATGLACFAVAGWAVAGANRVTRAEFTLGAAKVLTVNVPQGVNLESAVDQADPSGRYAMAAMISKVPSENLLAVQISRFRRVAYWPAGVSSDSLGALLRWLRSPAPPPLEFRGTAVRATVELSGSPDPVPDLLFNLIDSSGHPGVADFGYLSPGLHTYQAVLPSSCLGGCHATQLVPVWNPNPGGPQAVDYSVTLAGLEVQSARGSWAPASSRSADPGYWSPSGYGMAVAGGRLAGHPALELKVDDQSSDTTSPLVSPGALPQLLHGVVTTANSVSDPAAASAEDFDGTSLLLDVTRSAEALPQLGYQGFLINLSTATRAETSPPSSTTDQVWLAPRAPASVERSLRTQGLRVLQTRTPATSIQTLNHGGLALAYVFFLFAAGAAAVLALGSAVFSVFMNSRRRAFELAVLRAIGLPGRALLRSLLAEQLLVLVPGVLLGLLAGLVGALLALPSVPEFTSTLGGPPVELFIPVLPVVAMVAVLAVLLGVSAWLAAAVTLRSAGWERLRTEIR